MRAALRAVFAIALLGALIAAPGISLCAPPEVDVTSDRLEQHDDMYIFTGSVRFKSADYTLWSDRALYNGADSTMKAEGSVIINSAEFKARGQRADMDMDKATGVLYDAEVHFLTGDYFMDARELGMLGGGHFLLRDANLTTCVDLPPAWCFRGSEVDVLVGERIKATHARFKIKNVPVFYTPYLWAPIVTDRRTGLLPPNFGFRKSTGMHISQPFFWAISDNRDATVTLDYHTEEATGQQLEYRYIEAPHIRGQWNIMHLKDTEQAEDYIETELQHRHDGESVAGFLHIQNINREDYYRLYEDYLEDSSRRYLESTAELFHARPPEKPLGNSRIYLGARYYQDLKEGVDQDSVLQRAGETGISLAPFGPGSLDVFGRVRAVQFEREQGAHGRRADLEAGTSLTLGSALILRQEAGIARHTYEVQEDGQPDLHQDNTVHSYRADLGLTTSRAYGGVTHEIGPSLIYERASLIGNSPVFFDRDDLASEQSVVTFQVISRFLRKGQRLVSIKLSQPYDLLDAAEPYRPFEASLSARQAGGPLSMSAALRYDHYRKQATSMSSRLKFDHDRFGIEVGQEYNREYEIETYSVDGMLRVSDRLELLAGLKYDEAEEGDLEETSAGVLYQSQCWGIKLSYVRKPDDYAIYVEASLLGIGGAGIN